MNGGIKSDWVSDRNIERLKAVLAAKPLAANQPCSDMDFPPIIVGAARNQVKCVEVLIDAGAELDIQDCHGMTPLMWGCKNGAPKVARMLIERGARMEIHSEGGRSALMWAAIGCNVDCAQALVEAGADVHAKNKDGMSALDFAKSEGRAAIIPVLEAASSERNMEAHWKKSFKLWS